MCLTDVDVSFQFNDYTPEVGHCIISNITRLKDIQRLPYFPRLDIFNNAHSWHFGNQCAMLPLQNTQSNNAKKKPHNKHKNDRLNALIPPVSSCGRQAEESGELPQSPQSSVACTHRMEPHWRRKSRCLFGLE